MATVQLTTLILAVCVGCASSKFSSETPKDSGKKGDTAVPANNDPSTPDENTVYVPVGGTKDLGRSGECSTADSRVADCENGTITGNEIGTTTVIGSDGSKTTVVVYDPANPPAEEQLAIDNDAISKPQPTPSWVCGHYNDPNPHTIALSSGFVPRFSRGYTLHIRPDLNHCTGIKVSVTITGKDSGNVAKIPCNDGPCEDRNFQIGLKTKDSWSIDAEDLEELVGGTSPDSGYTLAFTWIENFNYPGSTCYQPNRYVYGLAFALTRSGDKPPTSGTPACTGASSGGGYDLTP